MAGRDHRIDFLRGFALLWIFIDHIPNNVLWLGSLRAFSLADAAELFFFLSGYVAAIVYMPAMRRDGFLAGAARIWRRSWDIYIAQIVLMVIVLAEVCALTLASHSHWYIDYFHIGDFLGQPLATIGHALTLRFQPALLDILPLYVLFFAALPFLLVLLARRPWLVLLASFAVYCGVQLFGWHLATAPTREPWFFDPLAWQMIFVLGAAVGVTQSPALRTITTSRLTIAAAWIVAIIFGAIEWSVMAHILFPSFSFLEAFRLPADKTTMAPLRLISFAAVAILAYRYVPQGSVLLRFRLARAFIRCGKHSLAVFCAGVVLAVIGAGIWHATDESLWVSPPISIAGIALLLIYAARLDQAKERRRARGGVSPSVPAFNRVSG